MAAFALQWQGWVVASETFRPSGLTYLLSGPLHKMFADFCPRESMVKLSQTIKELQKVARYKFTMQESITFIYTNNNQLEEIMDEKTPFTIASNKKKYFRINLIINVQNQYEENYKTFPKDTIVVLNK